MSGFRAASRMKDWAPRTIATGMCCSRCGLPSRALRRRRCPRPRRRRPRRRAPGATSLGPDQGRARQQPRSTRASGGRGRRDQALRRAADHALVTRPGDGDDPPHPAGELAQRGAPALLHRGRPAGGLSRARGTPGLLGALLAADPRAQAPERPDRLGARRDAQLVLHRAHAADRRSARAARDAVQERQADLERARGDRQEGHAHAARPVLDPRAPEGAGRQEHLRSVGVRHQRVLEPVRLAGRRRGRHPRHEPAEA